MGGLWSERFTWTEERIELLKTRWAAGLSGSLIADEFGVSRNSVIGKIHRLGLGRVRGAGSGRTLTQRPRGWQSHQQPRQAQPGPIRRKGFVLKGGLVQDAKYDVHGMNDLAPEIAANPVTLMQLEPDHCRWPCEGQGMATLFCGGDKLPGHAYCERHCRMAYSAPARPPKRYHWTDDTPGRPNRGRRAA